MAAATKTWATIEYARCDKEVRTLSVTETYETIVNLVRDSGDAVKWIEVRDTYGRRTTILKASIISFRED